MHARNGVAHLIAPSEGEALALGRRLVGFLPGVGATRAGEFAPGGADPGEFLPGDLRRGYDMRAVIRAIADSDSMLELAPRWARNMITAFIRIGGRPVGVVANQPKHLGGAIDGQGSTKGAWFTTTCDRLGIPLVVLVDTPGFLPGQKQETEGIIRQGAALVRAFAEATVPRITVVVRKAFGGGYIAMNSRGLGADAWFTWPSTQVGVLGAAQAVDILHEKELAALDDPSAARAALTEQYQAALSDPAVYLSDHPLDRAIQPAETRGAILQALDHVLGRASQRPSALRGPTR